MAAQDATVFHVIGMRWFLSTDSLGVKRLSLSIGVAAAVYGVVVHYPENNQYHPDTTWEHILSVFFVGLFWFLCTWVPIRLVAWIASGFKADRSRKPSN